MKLSVVMAHYKREEHLYNALWGYRQLHFPEELKDVEFVVVDDGGGKSETFWKVIKVHQNYLNITVGAMTGTRNPSLPMNFGLKLATGKIVVLTNAENIPLTPHLLTDISRRMDKLGDVYLSCGCYNLDARETKSILSKTDWTSRQKVVESLKKIRLVPRMGARGRAGWYNHSVYRPAHLYFLVAIRRSSLIKIGGFDEDYAKGRAFEDADLIMRVRRSGVKVVTADDLVCIHPHHYNAALDMTPERAVGLRLNQELYKARCKNKGTFLANAGRQWGNPRKAIVEKWDVND